jgi:hypothetical protein
MKNYYFEKWIFRSVVFSIIILLFVVLINSGFDFSDKVYAKCEFDVVRCENPFYEQCDALDRMRGKDESVEFAKRLCNDKFLLGSVVVGEPPSWIQKNNFIIVIILIFIGFVLNHFLYNRPGQIKMRRRK